MDGLQVHLLYIYPIVRWLQSFSNMQKWNPFRFRLLNSINYTFPWNDPIHSNIYNGTIKMCWLIIEKLNLHYKNFAFQDENTAKKYLNLRNFKMFLIATNLSNTRHICIRPVSFIVLLLVHLHIVQIACLRLGKRLCRTRGSSLTVLFVNKEIKGLKTRPHIQYMNEMMNTVRGQL